MDDWTRLADHVRRRRDALRMTQDDLVEASGLSGFSITKIENAKARLRATSRRQLEVGLSWAPGSVSDILAGGEPTESPEADPMPRDAIPDIADAILEIMRTEGREAGEAALDRARELASYAFAREQDRSRRGPGAI